MDFLTVENLDPIAKLIGRWLLDINLPSILIRLFLALIIGGALGLERSSKKHPAGLRTYILVCIGSTIASMTNQFMTETFGADSSRIGANIITGIGFLGAGTIIVTSRSKIRGLTTAAGLWCAACIGMAIGIGFYTLAICGFILVLLSLQILPILESKFLNNAKYIDLHVEFKERPNLKIFIQTLRDKGIKIVSIEHNPAYSQSGLSVYEITIEFNHIIKSKEANSLIKEWQNFDYIEYIERS